jgi:hypothetical protein
MKPIVVPLVVALTLKRFSARVLIKVKPFWESNRIWFGFYRKPELKLELEVEPIISNKFIKISMVNEVIQKRIKDSLEAYVMLPNMDDLCFWNFDNLNQSPFEKNESGTESEYDINFDTLNDSSSGFVPDDQTMSERDSIVNASLLGEALESNFDSTFNRKKSIANYISNVEPHLDNFSTPLPQNWKYPDSPGSSTTVPESDISQDEIDSIAIAHKDVTYTELFGVSSDTGSASDTASSYVEYLGTAAYTLGKISRQIVLDHRTQQLVSHVATIAKPAVDYAASVSTPYAKSLQTQAVNVGLNAIEILGLKPEDESKLMPADASPYGSLTKKQSNTWSLLGLNISTRAPETKLRKKKSSVSFSSSVKYEEESSPIDLGELYMESGEIRMRKKATDADITPMNSPKLAEVYLVK